MFLVNNSYKTGFKWFIETIENDNSSIVERTKDKVNITISCSKNLSNEENTNINVKIDSLFLFRESFNFCGLNFYFGVKYFLLWPVIVTLDITHLFTNPIPSLSSILLSPYCIAMGLTKILISLFSGLVCILSIPDFILSSIEKIIFEPLENFGKFLYEKATI